MTLRGPDRRLADGSERPPDLSLTLDDLEVLGDLAMVPANGYLRHCRECDTPFTTRLASRGNKWTDCCPECLRWLG